MNSRFQIKIDALANLMDIHDMSLDLVVEEATRAFKANIKEELEAYIKTRKYPVEIKLGEDYILIVNEDGSKIHKPITKES